MKKPFLDGETGEAIGSYRHQMPEVRYVTPPLPRFYMSVPTVVNLSGQPPVLQPLDYRGRIKGAKEVVRMANANYEWRCQTCGEAREGTAKGYMSLLNHECKGKILRQLVDKDTGKVMTLTQDELRKRGLVPLLRRGQGTVGTRGAVPPLEETERQTERDFSPIGSDSAPVGGAATASTELRGKEKEEGEDRPRDGDSSRAGDGRRPPEVSAEGLVTLRLTLPADVVTYFNMLKVAGIEKDFAKPLSEWIYECITAYMQRVLKVWPYLVPVEQVKAEEEAHAQ